MTWPTPPNAGGNNVSDNYDSLLGGRSTPSASFKGQFPILWEGYVEDASKKPAYVYDPSKPGNRGAQRFWDDGNPVENLWITLRTDVRDPSVEGDNGWRVLVLDSKNKIDAVQQAVRESGASFAKNGYLRMEWYGVDPNGKNPDNLPKLYRAQYRGATLDVALGQSGPPTSGAPAPQANWGGQAPTASPAPATGGWGNAQQASAAPAWGAQPAAPATTPAAGPTAGTAGGWGAAVSAPAPAAPSFDELLARGGPAAVLEALRKKGVPADQVSSPEQAAQLWALVQNNPDVTA